MHSGEEHTAVDRESRSNGQTGHHKAGDEGGDLHFETSTGG